MAQNKNNRTVRVVVEDGAPNSSGSSTAPGKGDKGVLFTTEEESVPSRTQGLDRAKPTFDSVNPEGYDADRRATSPSYSNPNANQNIGRTRGGSSLPTKGGLDNGQNSGLGDNGRFGLGDNGSRELEPAPNRNETAPDIGKDYGSPAEPPAGPRGQGGADSGAALGGEGPGGEGPGGGGTPPPEQGGGVPPAQGPEGGAGAHSNVDNELPKEPGLGDQSEAQKKGQGGQENGEGPDGEKKPGEEGQQQGEKGKGEGENPQNPEAKGGKNAPIGEENAGKPETQKPAGNGYGALRNKPGQQQNQAENQDVTRQARTNAERSQRMANEKAQENGRWPKGKTSSGSINSPVNPTFGQRAKQFIQNRLTGGENKGGERNTENEAKIAGSGFSSKWGEVAKNWLLAHPMVLMALIVGCIVFLFILASTGVTTNDGTSGGHCNYSLSGITSSGNINLDGIQVEIVNCDAKKDNYEVIETVDFEKYVVGVALAEVSWHADYPAYFQAQIVAARGFALTRNKGMCPSNPDNCFYGYNPSTGKIRLRNCSNDQNYCDYDRPCYRKVRGEGEKAVVGLEAQGQEGAYIWKNQLDESTKAAVLAAAEEVKGKVLVDNTGNVVSTNYVNTDQQNWWALAQQGKNYEEILKEHYSGQNASSMSSATCSTVGNIDYGDYVLSSDGHEILHEPLDSFLQSKGSSLESFNSLIASNVEKAGWGTRAGVVAAAVTLIGELGNKYNVKVPYYWGGGHADGVVDGALGKWGSTQCHTYANGQSYDYCGLDCSGFVPWAIKNGGFNIAQMLAGNFQYLDGAQRVTLSSSNAVLQPGDLLESEHHIVLVIGIEESSGNYICAEASGNAQGVLFTRRPFSGGSGYWGVNMDGFYANRVRSK